MKNLHKLTKQQLFKDAIRKATFLTTHNEERYNKDVLLGNWLNRRFERPEENQGIIPLLPPSTCPKHTSVYMDTFKPVPSSEKKALAEEFVDVQSTRYRNSMNCLNTHIFKLNSQALDGNMTTTKDVHYDIQPKVYIRGENLSRKQQRAAEEDVLQSYGNYTNFGLRRYLNCQNSDVYNPFNQTTYKAAYSKSYPR